MGLLSTFGAASGRAFGLTRLSAAIKDAYFNLTTLLLPGNGTNGAQNNTFLDSSTNNFTITRNGNTTQGTFSPFSQTGWSNYFDASSYLNVGTTRFLDASAWTVEMWVNTTSTANSVTLAAQYVAGGGGFAQRTVLGINNSSGTVYIFQGGTAQSGTTNVADGRWHHIAFVLSAGTVKAYVDGINEATFSSFGSPTAVTTTFFYDSANSSSYFLGYASNLRVTNTAVYTANFTVPTSPLTAITGTQLLTCQSNRFIDNSTNNYAITVNGTPSVQAFSPFAPTAAYSAATNGGSGYSDGTGDYLTIATNANLTLGSSDFTIELWWYPTAFNSDGEIFTMGSNAGTNRCYAMYSSGSNGTLAAFAGTGGSSWDIVSNLSMGTAIRNAWNHMAFTRSGTTFSTYLNGVRIATTTASGTLGSNALGVFANNSGTSAAPASYIGGARTIKGTALYTGTTYTIPTAPFTAVTNTNLLLNFTNAGITDATAKNDLETVGNAQISTTQSKWGGSSMYFDGTGDYLFQSGNSPQNALGTGDFTIEYWIYFSALSGSTASVILDYRPSSTAGAYPTMYINTSFKLVYEANSGTRITSSTSISTGTWYHVAFVRASGSTKMYLNGTNEGATYTDSTNYLGSSGRPIIAADGYTLGSQAMNGYIDDLRITKGYARYTANFTAPTAAFPVQ